MREYAFSRFFANSLRIVGIVALYVAGVVAVIAGPLWLGWPPPARAHDAGQMRSCLNAALFGDDLLPGRVDSEAAAAVKVQAAHLPRIAGRILQTPNTQADRPQRE